MGDDKTLTVLEEVWAAEPNIRVQIAEGENGRAVIRFIDESVGRVVFASATIEDFRRDRLARAIAKATGVWEAKR